MDFVTAIKLYFNNYVNFSGRSSRPAYWWPVLMNILVCLIISWIVPESKYFTLNLIISGLWALVNLLPGLAVCVRRLHDIDKSWVWILISLVPLVGTIWFVVLMAQPGNPGSNEYGPAPMQ